ncbi:MAG: acyl-CoA thioesterase [Chitinophagaceae bacterium]
MEKNPSSYYKVRFSDCDLFGHLNNARYIDYFVDAREDHLKEHYDIDLKTFYGQGIAWVVGSHEIIYRRPALYNERIYITSSVLKVTDDVILVEMLMMDEKKSHFKSIVWTTFIPVNVKTGKKEKHTASFMEFAAGVEVSGIDIASGIREREKGLRLLLQE